MVQDPSIINARFNIKLFPNTFLMTIFSINISVAYGFWISYDNVLKKNIFQMIFNWYESSYFKI